jgi:hypothetical protein
VNRRQALEVLRAGPALVTGFPGDAVDIDGLLAHLIGSGFEGGIYLADLEMESLVWVHRGEAQDAWFFDVDGGEAVLAGAGGHDLFREMAANGSMLSVYVGAPPDVAFGQAAGPPSGAPATVFKVPGQTIVTSPVAPPPPQPVVEVSTVDVPALGSQAADPVVISPPPPSAAAAPAPPAVTPTAVEPVAAEAPVVESQPIVPPPVEAVSTPSVSKIAPPAPEPLAKKKRPAPDPAAEPEVAVPPQPLPAIDPPAPVEPSRRPWPRTLEGVAERVARHRGQRLAQRFTATLAAAIAPHGGRLEGTRVVAPPMSEAAWRVIVEAACEPIVAVAGRAFVDKTIAAAEREAVSGDSGSNR